MCIHTCIHTPKNADSLQHVHTYTRTQRTHKHAPTRVRRPHTLTRTQIHSDTFTRSRKLTREHLPYAHARRLTHFSKILYDYMYSLNHYIYYIILCFMVLYSTTAIRQYFFAICLKNKRARVCVFFYALLLCVSEKVYDF